MQSSAMDCGPASLAALVNSLGLDVSYPRLRELCCTDRDGTSIDTMEEVANDLGMPVEQVMVPYDFLLADAERCLPAVVVVLLPSGSTHFVTVSKITDDGVEVMDPAVGRRRLSRREFSDSVYVHRMKVDVSDWLEWARSDEFRRIVLKRGNALGLAEEALDAMYGRARESSDWRDLAALDATIRACARAVESGEVSRTRVAGSFGDLLTLVTGNHSTIDRRYFQVTACETEPAELLFQGVLLLRSAGEPPRADAAGHGDEESSAASSSEADADSGGSKRLLAFRLMTSALGNRAGRYIGMAAALIGVLSVLEVSAIALLIRLSDTGSINSAYLLFPILATPILASLLTEYFASRLTLRYGRELDAKLTEAMLAKFQRLPDGFFTSRLKSDLLERAHQAQSLRVLPGVVLGIVGSHVRALAIVAMLLLIAPAEYPFFLAALVVYLVAPVAVFRTLNEKSIQAAAHMGALSRYYLDLLQGKDAMDAHAGAAPVLVEHEKLVAKWWQSEHAFNKAALTAEGVQWGGMILLAVLVSTRIDSTTGLLVTVFWMLQLAALCSLAFSLYRRLPKHHSAALRIDELLDSPDEPGADNPRTMSGAVRIDFRNADVERNGFPVLSGVSVAIDAGEHVAVVGESGSGKSSFLAAILGWLGRTDGEILIDGEPMSGPLARGLRASVAWVDPDGYLWNDSVLSNLVARGDDGDLSELPHILTATGVLKDLGTKPDGLETLIGDNGARLSGGEAQRLRIARAMCKKNPCLVLLDEALRGMGRDQRLAVLASMRERWSATTLIHVTHDPDEALAFPRVLVFANGRLVEDRQVRDRSDDSELTRLSRLNASVRAEFANGANWRGVEIDKGRIVADG